MTHLAYDIADGLATVTLRNPPQNRISAQMSDELAEAVDAIGKSKARALLLRAEVGARLYRLRVGVPLDR